jgi:hypothetical protein
MGARRGVPEAVTHPGEPIDVRVQFIGPLGHPLPDIGVFGRCHEKAGYLRQGEADCLRAADQRDAIDDIASERPAQAIASTRLDQSSRS